MTVNIKHATQVASVDTEVFNNSVNFDIKYAYEHSLLCSKSFFSNFKRYFGILCFIILRSFRLFVKVGVFTTPPTLTYSNLSEDTGRYHKSFSLVYGRFDRE